MSEAAPTSTARSAAVDLARVLGAVLIVLTHGAVAYFPTLPEGLLWPVHDPGASPSPLMRGVFLYGRLAGVGMFFVLAGSLAGVSLSRHAITDFVRSRLRRLGLPLLVGACTVLPATYFVWGFDAMRRGYIRADQLWGFKLSNADKDMLLGPAHLWFLEYLLCFTLIAALVRRAIPALAARPTRRAINIMMVALIGVMCACVLADPTMITGFRNALLPRPAFFLFNACLFGAGFFTREKARITLWPWLLVFSLPLAILPEPVGARERIILLATPLLTLAASFGWLGLAARFARTSPMLARCGNASFGVYIIHLPVVCAAQLLLRAVDIAPGLKFAACSAATLLVCFGASLVFTKNNTGPSEGPAVEEDHAR